MKNLFQEFSQITPAQFIGTATAGFIFSALIIFCACREAPKQFADNILKKSAPSSYQIALKK